MVTFNSKDQPQIGREILQLCSLPDCRFFFFFFISLSPSLSASPPQTVPSLPLSTSSSSSIRSVPGHPLPRELCCPVHSFFRRAPESPLGERRSPFRIELLWLLYSLVKLTSSLRPPPPPTILQSPLLPEIIRRLPKTAFKSERPPSTPFFFLSHGIPLVFPSF